MLKFRWFNKMVAYITTMAMVMYTSEALAEPSGGGSGNDIGTIAHNIKGTFTELAQLVTAVAYVAGMGFAMASILKFKAHRDNPTQIPIGTPIALLFVAAALLFLPSLFSIAGGTVFGSSATAGGISGTTSF